jgi:Fur family peroxide stress response transcriptional regulator
MKEKVEGFVQQCRERGISVTPQRIAVFKQLSATETHPSAEEIYVNLRKELPSLSLGTVYKTLEAFEKYGFISKTRPTGERARFDANLTPHHHLICRVCGRIEDFYDKTLARFPLSGRIRARFKVEEYRIDFRGICKECKKKKKNMNKNKNAS